MVSTDVRVDIGNGECESDMKTVCTCTRVLCAATISIQECGPLLLARYLNFYARRRVNMTGLLCGCVPFEAWSGDSRPRPSRTVV